MPRRTIAPSDAVAINAVLVAVRQAADVLCDRWVLALILAAFLGENRFAGFSQRAGMAGRLVTARLRSLVAAGIFLRVPYSRRPLRREYRLTNMGLGLFDVVIQMIRWEQNWHPDRKRALLNLTHAACGKNLRPELRCKACNKPATARDIALKVSRAHLRQMPVKQTAYRRSTVSSERVGGRSDLLGPSLDIFGDKWSIEIIICAFLRIRRFSDFRTHTGISANILTDRLERLVSAGIFVRLDSRHPREEAGYRLSERGIDIYGVLVAIQEWADTWLSERYRSPVRLIHRKCGEVFHPVATCAACRESVRSCAPHSRASIGCSSVKATIV